ncbi:MAG: hypothetical protein E8D41_10815 [Nitrospira sp.]|nr:MAG: hypothetical protein E8D41_10815 [Nitrospira sp.]
MKDAEDGLPHSQDWRAYSSDVGRRFRTFNLLDEGVREVLAIDVDTALPTERMILVLPVTA